MHDKRGRHSYSFDKCLEVAQNDIKVVSADERSALSILDAYRDTAVHYYQEVSKEGDPVVGTVIKQEVNIWDKYNLGRDNLAERLGLSGPKTSALILELGIQEDPECFKILRRNKTTSKGYSKVALDRLRNAIGEGINVNAVWEKHRHRFGGRKRG